MLEMRLLENKNTDLLDVGCFWCLKINSVQQRRSLLNYMILTGFIPRRKCHHLSQASLNKTLFIHSFSTLL